MEMMLKLMFKISFYNLKIQKQILDKGFLDDNLYDIVSEILVFGLKDFCDCVFKIYLDDIKDVSLGSERKKFR